MFKTLYYFSSRHWSLIEIKRLDLPEDSPASQLYYWLRVSHIDNHIFRMRFVSMTDDSRTFCEGRLDLLGEFHIGELKFPLDQIVSNQLPLGLQESIQEFISQAQPEITLRNLTMNDLPSFNKWLKDPEVIQFSLTHFHRIKNEGDIKIWLEKTFLDKKTVSFGIEYKNELIGYTGLSGINEIDRNAEFFILIGEKSLWGRGIASNMTEIITRFGYEYFNLHRIFLTASSANRGALKVYAKNGYVKEGVLRDAFFRNGQFSDKIIMGLLNSEWSEDKKKGQPKLP